MVGVVLERWNGSMMVVVEERLKKELGRWFGGVNRGGDGDGDEKRGPVVRAVSANALELRKRDEWCRELIKR